MNKVNIPTQFRVIKNDFLEENSDSDFIEDILQIEHKTSKLIVDLGWYGNEESRIGTYSILVIKDFDWDNPILLIEEKSKEEISIRLNILLESMVEAY